MVPAMDDDQKIQFEVDDEAERGDVLPALARLLIRLSQLNGEKDADDENHKRRSFAVVAGVQEGHVEPGAS